MSKQKIREWLVENYNKLADMETADIIDQYTKDQSAWVSVNDRLPEQHQNVISCGKDGRRFNSIFRSTNGGGYLFSCVLSVHDHDNVTHWQPLPLPPTQEA